MQEQYFIKRNYYFMMGESALFWIASAFFNENAVISVFINEFTGSLQLAGLATVLGTVAFVIGQFLAGSKLYSIRNYERFTRKYGFIGRPAYFLMLPILLFFKNGYVIAFCMIGCIALFNFADGYVGLAYNSIAARTIPDRYRGQMMAYSRIFAGIGSILAGFLVTYLLNQESIAANYRYMVIFGCGSLIFLLNAGALCCFKDRDDLPPASVQKLSLKSYCVQFLPVWKAHPYFRKVIYARGILQIGLMASTLIVLFGKTDLYFTTAQTSAMVYVQMFGLLCGGILWGRLSRTRSTFAVMSGTLLFVIVSGILGCAAFLLRGTSLAYPLFCTLVFLTGLNSIGWIGFTNEIIRIATEETRVLMLVMLTLTQLAFSFAPYLASLIAEKFSFFPVFVLVLFFGLMGLGLVGSMRRDAQRAPESTVPP